MGLKGDWDEAKKMWSNSSLLMKLIITVSLFVNIGSIASLSETIFKWKSFILEGLSFYHDYIADPVTQTLNLIGLHYSRTDINVLFLISLYAGSYFRAVGTRELWRDFKSKPISNSLVYLCFTGVYIYPGLFEGDSITYFILLIYVIAIIASLVSIYKNRKDDPDTAIRFLFVPLTSLLVVMIFGAINSGLLKH
ncbi:hypothetical protein [Pseudomonas sp. P1.8]|jgi:hypothetical protein|uniref:hypothetical protein n=1 Tax=Pseudomonas sp. P1.8 TaxID=1699310 RepID=UPI00069DBE23|nr:hypothetical protein [Pseudomonas sp. P1.8]